MADENAARLLLNIISEPKRAETITQAEWRCIIGLARREGLLGILAYELDASNVLGAECIRVILQEALQEASYSHQLARWESAQLARDLSGCDVQIVLLKGTAYAVADLACAPGRLAGDLDILVPYHALTDIENALHKAGWQAENINAYDAHYYRAWMHEIPPLKHPARVMELDVHHTLLPRTGRIHPKPKRLLEKAEKIAGTPFYRLCLPDLIIHACVHVLQDGDLTKGLRTLVDVHRLVCAGALEPNFWDDLLAHCAVHEAGRPVLDTLTLCRHWLNTPVPAEVLGKLAPKRSWLRQTIWQNLADKRLQDPDGRSTLGWIARNYFYMRAHWRKMPPFLLMRHLLIKTLRRLGL